MLSASAVRLAQPSSLPSWVVMSGVVSLAASSSPPSPLPGVVASLSACPSFPTLQRWSHSGREPVALLRGAPDSRPALVPPLFRRPPKALGGVDFSNAEFAYKDKSTAEILRAIAVFKVCGIKPITNNSKRLLTLSAKVFGEPLTLWLVKKTFFAHFCAGENEAELVPVVNRFKASGVGSILDYAAEEDLPEEVPREPRDGVMSARIFDYAGEEQCDKNTEVFLKCIEGAKDTDSFVAIKLSALGKPALLERMTAVLFSVRKAWHDYFGMHTQATLPEFTTALRKMGCKLSDHEIRHIFELFANKDANSPGVIDYIEWTKMLGLDDLISANEVSGAFDYNSTTMFAKTGYKMSQITSGHIVPMLDSVQTKLMSNLVKRLDTIVDAAVKNNVKLLVDAEQTYLQLAIDHFTRNLMAKYNKDRAVVFNTYQCYLKRTPSHIATDIERARRDGYKFAAKLVRGAYMVLERARAAEKGYKDPIFPTIEDTHKTYDNIVEMILRNPDTRAIMLATHNQQTIEKAVALMNELKIDRKNGGVYFGQLMGMSDHLSFTLGRSGFRAFKYVPYGPVKEVMEYLIRRGQENSMLFDKADGEAALLVTEVKRRFGLRSAQ